MFTSIVVPPAVVIINESDLAPVLEELTRRSHVIITGAVTRQEVTSCQGVREVFFFWHRSLLSLCQRKESLCKDSLCTRLATVPCGLRT